ALIVRSGRGTHGSDRQMLDRKAQLLRDDLRQSGMRPLAHLDAADVNRGTSISMNPDARHHGVCVPPPSFTATATPLPPPSPVVSVGQFARAAPAVRSSRSWPSSGVSPGAYSSPRSRMFLRRNSSGSSPSA